MDLSYTPEEESFRAQVRGWLEANLPKSGLRGTVNRAHADKSTLEKMKEWHRRLYEAGYLALSWPKEYGGTTDCAVAVELQLETRFATLGRAFRR